MGNRPGTTDRLYLHGRCHMQAPTWVAYDFDRQRLTVYCAECKRVVVSFPLTREQYGQASSHEEG